MNKRHPTYARPTKIGLLLWKLLYTAHVWYRFYRYYFGRRNHYGVLIWWLQWEIRTGRLWAFADPKTGRPVWAFSNKSLGN